MKEFYKQMVRRWLSVEKWEDWETSPLETVVWQEGRGAEDARQVHDHIFRLMLKEIARMETEAEEYGGGEQDWMVSSFHRLLKDAREYVWNPDENSVWSLPPEELSRRNRALKYRQAAMVYPLRKQGMSPAQTAAELGISEEAVREAEKKLIRLLRRTDRLMDYHPRFSQMNPRIQTLITLEKGTYRVFRRKTETGVQYRFYCRDRLLGTASAGSGADFPLVLQCGALMFNSSFDPDSTIFPGVSRTVVDADDPTADAARLTWWERDCYELRLNWEPEAVTVWIECWGENHRFYRNDRMIGEILPLQQPQHMGEWEISFCMKLCEPLSDETALLLMSFPMLRFGL